MKSLSSFCQRSCADKKVHDRLANLWKDGRPVYYRNMISVCQVRWIAGRKCRGCEYDTDCRKLSGIYGKPVIEVFRRYKYNE